MRRCLECAFARKQIATGAANDPQAGEMVCMFAPPVAVPINMQQGMAIMSVRPAVREGDWCSHFFPGPFDGESGVLTS